MSDFWNEQDDHKDEVIHDAEYKEISADATEEKPAEEAAEVRAAKEVAAVEEMRAEADTDIEENKAAEEISTETEESQDAGQSTFSGSTYSWVNPKLKAGRNKPDSGKNVWNSSEGNNYWTEKIDPAATSADESERKAETPDTDAFKNTYQSETTSQAEYTKPDADESSKKSAKKEKRIKKGKPSRKTAGMHTGWAKLIAMGVVFGIVAGTVSYGVNRAETAVLGSGSSQQQSTQVQQVQTTNTTGDAAEKLETSDASTDTANAVAAGSVAEVAQNCMPAMVTISTMSVQEMESFFGGTQSYEVEGAGSGVIVSQTEDELLIATNNHVIEGAKELSVGFIDETAVTAAIKGTDTDNDLAIVAVKLSDIQEETMAQIKVIAIGDSDDLVLGEQVVAIGNALGLGQSVTSGYVSAFNRSLDLSDGTNTFTSDGLIQTDASINSGNSGGALLNMKGELIGINEAKSSSSSSGASVDNVGYAIPTSKAMPILETLMDMETREALSEDDQGYLGIHCVNVAEESSQMYNIPMGVYVSDVVEGGPAEAAGLKQGDVITAINSVTTSSYSALTDELQYCAPGETVTLTIQRSGADGYEEQNVEVTLGSKDVIADEDTEESEAEDSAEEDQTESNDDLYGNSDDMWGWFFGN